MAKVDLEVENTADDIAHIIVVYGMGNLFRGLAHALENYRDDKLTPPGREEMMKLDKMIIEVHSLVTDAAEVERLANE